MDIQPQTFYPKFNMNITQIELTLIENSFKQQPWSRVKTRPCRIKFNGKFITTTSKKTVWRNIGFAKNALLNHFQQDYTLRELAGILSEGNPVNGHRRCKELIRELEIRNLIEYVEVDISEYAEEKD